MILTRCPQCQTTFRAKPEHLKARGGQVRCGHCLATFDAWQNLVGTAPAVPPATPEAGPAATPITERLPAEPIERPAEPDSWEESELTEEAERKTGPEPAEEPEPQAEPELPEEAEPQAEAELQVEPEPPPATAPTREPEPLAAIAPETEQPAEPEPEAPATPRSESVTELAEAAPAEPRHWPWLLLALFTGTALAAQATLHFRTELATRLPGMRPVLEAMCEPIGCDIPLPAKIDLLEIEHSDLVPDEKTAGNLHLSATLRNRAAHLQTWPHLELTLTDTNDRALVRRALAPKDYLPTADLVAAGFAARGERQVQLDLRAADLPAVGYRLYLFYP